MKCKYCEHGMMWLSGDDCIEILQCVGCNAIALKDIELNRSEYIWYRKETTSGDSVLCEIREAFDDLLIEAMNLYQYYPNNFRKTAEEYFKIEIQLQKKLNEHFS